ncbi:MAG: helix-turn-helix transcriptional regulator [Deltaproteobacteria bacterium]|nr:helix-turn-helix transcriptional regulator [Deltaproteobacteria bacterium]
MPPVSSARTESGYRVRYWERSTSCGLLGLDATWSLQLAPQLGSLVHRPPACPAAQVIYDLVHRRLWIKGAHVRPEPTRLGADSRYCGLRLQPSAATWLVGSVAFDLRNRVLPWREVTRDPWWHTLSSALEDIGTADAALETFVVHLRRRPLPPIDRAAERARQLVDAYTLGAEGRDCADPSRLVDNIARSVDLSPRQLRRRFCRAVGLGIKAYQQTVRVRACAQRMLGEPATHLASIAHTAGFADQAHLTRQFRAHVGMTPSRYRSDYADLSDQQPAGTIRHVVA